MSSIVISGNTSGTVTISAPDVAGTVGLTLPSANGTILTTASAQTLASPTISGNITMTTGGITFNANPGGGTQATLNDYETGTYTPSMGSVGATITFGNQQGYYTKIGNIVFASGYMSVSGVSGTTTNALYLTGLPFVTKNQGNDGASCVFGVETFTAIPTAFTQPGGVSFNIYVQGTVTTMKASQISQSFYLYTAIYQTA